MGRFNRPRLSRLQVRLLIAGMVVGMLLALSVGMVMAQQSGSFNLERNTLVGGNGGGTTMQSTSFRLLTSSGPLQSVSITSTTYSLCSGYICQTEVLHDLNLPLLVKPPAE